MVNCFLCLVNIQNSKSFNIVKCYGSYTKTSYGDLIGKLLEEQQLVITISADNCICETCDTLINAFDYHNHEQDIIKKIISRQISASHLKSKVIAICIDEEAIGTFEKTSVNDYQCKQCGSFRTNKIEFMAAHFKAHQSKVHASTMVKVEIHDEDVVDDCTEVPIEEILLDTSACKYEDVDDETPVSREQADEDYEPTDVHREAGKKRRRMYRISNDPVTNYAASTRLPRYMRDVMKISKTKTAVLPKGHSDNLFVIEVPQIDTVGHRFTCKICLQMFVHPLKLASHLLTHKDIKYSCNHCLFTISNDETSIIEHMKCSHVGVDRYDFSMDISKKLANTCVRCGYHNNTIGKQCSHEIAIIRGMQRFYCKLCSGDFYGLEIYKNHLHVEHQHCRYCNKTILSRFNQHVSQHKCLESATTKKDFEVSYYDMSAYDWYKNKEEINNDDDDDVEVKTPVQRPTEVIMKVIHSKPTTKPKLPKMYLPKSRSNTSDECQDKITTYFNELFPIKYGENSNESCVSQYFCIDDSSRATNGMIKCKICLETFQTTLKLRYHLVSHKNLTYHCQHCPIEVPNNEYGMRFHLRTAHENESKYDFTITDSGEIVNVCSICSENVEPGMICSHEKAVVNGVGITTCRDCSKTFYGDEALREHCHIEHCRCKHCQRTFVRPASLARHFVNHQNKEYFKCHTCQKVLSSVGTYTNHLSEHTGNYKYTCDVCDRKFNVKLSYEEHLRSHDSMKKYICHICGQGFIHSATFLIHKIWHTNPLPFQCIVCKKLYRTRSALRMHDRKVHLKTPTHICPECNKGLYSPADLRTHMVVHTGIYNYPCDLCPSKFFRSDRLRRHRKNCHGIEVPKKQIEYKVAIRPLLGENQ